MFMHDHDSSGDNVESTFDGKELAGTFDEGGQFIGEMMDYVISNWKLILLGTMYLNLATVYF
jgi:hypothetical protein